MLFEPTPIDSTPPGVTRPSPVRYVPETSLRLWKRVAIALAIACGILLLLLASGGMNADARRGLPVHVGEHAGHAAAGRG
jgi:hypothetical protein